MGAKKQASDTGAGVVLKFSFLSPQQERSGAGLIKVSTNVPGAGKMEFVVSPAAELAKMNLDKDWFTLATEISEHDLVEDRAVVQTKKIRNAIELDFASDAILRKGILDQNSKVTVSFLRKVVSEALESADLDLKFLFEKVTLVRLFL